MASNSFKRKKGTAFSPHLSSDHLHHRFRLRYDDTSLTEESPTSGLAHFGQSPGLRKHSLNAMSRAADEGYQPDVEQEDLDQVVMAVDARERGTVGCAYYVAQEEKLFFLGDVQSGAAATIEILKLEVKPTVILCSTRADDLIATAQERPAQGEDQFRMPYQIDIRPSQEFNPQGAKNKLVTLEVFAQDEESTKFLVPCDGITNNDRVDPEDVGFTAQKGKALRLAGFIDMENTVTLGCAGAILTYLQRKRASRYLPGDESVPAFRVRSMEMFSLQGTMYINADTLASLQIIQSESHPSAFNQGPGRTSSGSKESLSVYGLFHHLAQTPQGKAHLRRFFLRPSTEINALVERHDFISVFLRPDNASALQKAISSLKKIKNLRPVMINLHKGFNTGSGTNKGFKTTVWGTLLAFAFHSIDIQEALREVAGGESITFYAKALKTLDVVSLHKVGRMVHEIVDIDSSEEQYRTVVRSGVDRELDLMKDRYNGLDNLLKRVAIDIAMTIPEELDIDVNVIYFPQLGFNIAIPFDISGRPAYDGKEEDWEQIFTTENRVYFKDFRMREMDDKLGDIYGLICEREIEIVYDLAQRVLEFENALIEASDLCGELDCLLAMVQAASLYKFVRPRITGKNVIKIKGGRHPLQELSVPSYVPNDTYLIGGQVKGPLDETGLSTQDRLETAVLSDGPSMLLLTGPNYSGKSVYLKQVALIVYLAHIGSFVPAECAEIGITDKILTRITTQDTVSKIQSTFMIDLQQVSLALKLFTNRSLLIIDEFGKGTDWGDGAGLACGIFEHLLNRGDERPKVLAATHFHEIFESGYLRPRSELAFWHMEIRFDEHARGIGEKITYLYNLVPGRSNKSFGTVCAEMNGIDKIIVARANEIAALSARGENLVASCAKISATETETLEEAEVMARKFLELDLSAERNQSSGYLDHWDMLRTILGE